MARTFDHERLTAEAFSAALDEAGLSLPEFVRLTGVHPTSPLAWLKPAGHPKAQEPPFWVTSWLSLYLLPGAAERARTVAETMLLRDNDDEA